MKVIVVKNMTAGSLQNNINNHLKELEDKEIVSVNVTAGFDGEDEVLVGTILYKE